MDLARGSLFAGIYRVSGMFFWMLLGILTARYLTVDDRGVYVTSVAIVGAVASVAASFASASGYFVTKGGRPAAEVAANGMVLALVSGGALLGICLVLWAVWPWADGHVPLLVGLALFPIIARNALGGVFLGTNQIWKYNFSIHGPGYVAVALLLFWVFVLDQRTLEAALGTWIAAQYLSLALLAGMGLGWWSWIFSHRPDVVLIRRIVAFGAVTGLAGFISFFNYRIDLLLVAGIDGKDGAGVYSTAVQVAEGLWLFSTAISIASYSAVGLLSREDASELTTRSVRHTLLVVSILCVGVFVLAPFIVETLFGERYGGAANSLRVLCLGTALFAPVSLLSNYFTVQLGRPSISLWLASLSCVINVIVSLLLIPQVGYVGGAWATTISYAASTSIATILFLRISGAPFGDLWRIRGDDLASYFRLGRRILSGELFRHA